MFRTREPQESLWQSEFLITPRKARLMRRSWAQVFRNEAVPLIDEERFAEMYSADMGRPNRAVQTVLGVLVLKEMFDLTDIEALEELEFNLLWHHALGLEMDEAHLAQKTLHNFRVRLMEHDGGRLAFCETTDRMIEALGLRTGKQRLDSTHVMSNIAVLTRLGLFCETVRVFLLAVSREHPGLGEGIGDGLAQRYLKETGEASRYEDARSGEGRRRLSVCARDVYRLVDRFRGTAVAQMDEYGLLERLLREQCHVGRHGDGRPSADDDDAGEGKVPIALREPREVRSDSLQTPHDPAVTYSGHKGKGYEVQVSNARNYVPVDREIARNYRPLRQVIDHPVRRIGDHCCRLDVRSSDGVQGGVESGDSRSGASLAVRHQPARHINWYGAVASDSAQVHRGGRGGGAGPGRSCSE